MSYTEMLQKHRATCGECERVRKGQSPFCSTCHTLEILAEDNA